MIFAIPCALNASDINLYDIFGDVLESAPKLHEHLILIFVGVFISTIAFLIYYKLGFTRAKNTLASFESMLDSLSTCVMAKDVNDNFKIVLCNKSCCEFFNLKKEEILGKNSYSLLSSAKEAAEIMEADSAACSSKSGAQSVSTFTLKSGDIRIGKFYRKSVPMPDGRRYLFTMIADITELENYKKKLEDSNKLWDTLINAVPFYILVKDASNDFRYSIVNDSFAKYLGGKLCRTYRQKRQSGLPRKIRNGFL